MGNLAIHGMPFNIQMRMPNDNLQQVLEGYEKERIELDVKFLNQALVAATLNNNHECIGKLVKIGATNIDECIELAKEEELDYPIIILLFMKAALTGDETFLNLLLRNLTPRLILQELPHGHLLELNILKIIWAYKDGCHLLSTTDALEVAQWCGQYSVHRKLMILTCRSNRTAGWSKLNLMYVDARVLEMCNGITDLDLSANKLSFLPSNVGILHMVSSQVVAAELRRYWGLGLTAPT